MDPRKSAGQGGPAEDYQTLKNYQPSRADLEKMISGKPVFTKVAARSLLFESFQAASADGELHAKEREAIYQLGRAMGVEEEVLKVIEKAAADDKTNRHRIVAVLFPQGVKGASDTALCEFQDE